MCWNPDISLNTFVFGFLSLIFLYFTNTFSKYKITEFSNPLLYLFLLDVISVQLVEFFLWRNLNDKILNRNFSAICLFLVGIQPLLLTLMVQEPFTRNTLLFLYGLFGFIYLLINGRDGFKNIHTSVAKNGHLYWSWEHSQLNLGVFQYVLGFSFLALYLLSAYFIGKPLLFLWVALSMAISLYYYFKAGTFGSMWCWMANSVFLFLIIYVLIVLPFREYKSLC